MRAGVEATMPKFERAWPDDTIATRLSESSWGPRAPGFIVILGKQFILSTFKKRDTRERIAEAIILLRAILYQAEHEDKWVFESSIRRALGVWVYITDGPVFLRIYLRGMIRALTAAGSWSSSKLPAASSEYSWRMAQATFLGAAAYTKSTAAYGSWLESWRALPLGKKCKIPNACKGQFEALCASILRFNEQTWMPRRSPVPANHIVYLMLDSAGLSKEDPTSKRACGGWAYCEQWDEIKWFQETWCPQILAVAHSTIMEASNGISCLEYAIKTWEAMVFVEIYDSGAAVDIFRSMASRSLPMRRLLKTRFDVLLKHPHVRALPHWQSRTLGFIAGVLSGPIPALLYLSQARDLAHSAPAAADGFTKFETDLCVDSLLARLPHLRLADKPEPKPPNVINNPAYAAQWTAKENEAFDD